MRKVYSLFSGSTPIETGKFADVMRNPEKHRKKVSAKAKREYKTLKAVNLETAGHITFHFQSKAEKRVRADMERLEKRLRSKGIGEVWHRGIHKFGDEWYGLLESLTVEVLSKY